MSSNFGDLKIFLPKSFIEGLNKILHKCLTVLLWKMVNELKPGCSLCSKSPIFSLNVIKHPFWMKMYQHFSRIQQYSAESSERLQPCAEFYGCKQNAMVINNAELNILFIFVHFDDEQFWFTSVKDFELLIKILILVFSNSNSNPNLKIWIAQLLMQVCFVALTT